MIELKNPLVKVKCLECGEKHSIDIKLIGTEKEQRSISFEYEHTYRGEKKCSHCDEEMSLLIEIYEYPKEFLNSLEIKNKSCNLLDKITEESLIIT